MADPESPMNRLLNSQEFAQALFARSPSFETLIGGDPAAVSQDTIDQAPSVEFRQNSTMVSDLIPPSQPFTNDNDDNNSSQEQPIPQRTVRKRFSYARRKLVADYRLFLHSEFISEFQAHAGERWDRISIRGQIVECPLKRKNGMTYVVEWHRQDIAMGDFNFLYLSFCMPNFDIL